MSLPSRRRTLPWVPAWPRRARPPSSSPLHDHSSPPSSSSPSSPSLSFLLPFLVREREAIRLPLLVQRHSFESPSLANQASTSLLSGLSRPVIHLDLIRFHDSIFPPSRQVEILSLLSIELSTFAASACIQRTIERPEYYQQYRLLQLCPAPTLTTLLTTQPLFYITHDLHPHSLTRPRSPD